MNLSPPRSPLLVAMLAVNAFSLAATPYTSELRKELEADNLSPDAPH